MDAADERPARMERSQLIHVFDGYRDGLCGPGYGMLFRSERGCRAGATPRPCVGALPVVQQQPFCVAGRAAIGLWSKA